jgi:hypothetical protein
MVTPFFTSADIDTTFLLNSSKTTAFSNFNRTIPFEEGKVLDSFKDFMACTQGLFSVNSSNLFQWQCYGPKNLNQTIEAIGTSDIVSSSFDNSEDDYFNRFIIKYNWDFLSNRSLNKVEGKLAGWNKSYDRPLEINAKWINSTNEANILCYRLQVRYKNTIPHVNFRTNLNKVGYDLGTLLSVSDVNSGLSNKIVQLVSFQKDWENKTIDWNALDAESLYMRRGFAFWMGGTTLPGEAVSGTSISGWGTNGTVTNINTTIFGTQFVWF